MLGLRSKHTNRPELIERYGYDSKFAYHALRLGLQGIELLLNGSITLPMEPEHRSFLKDVRLGKWTQQQVLEEIDYLANELAALKDSANVPDKPDYTLLNRWLVEGYQYWWASRSLIDNCDQVATLVASDVNTVERMSHGDKATTGG